MLCIENTSIAFISIKNKSLIKKCMHDEQSLHKAVYVKVHDAVHEKCMRPST